MFPEKVSSMLFPRYVAGMFRYPSASSAGRFDARHPGSDLSRVCLDKSLRGSTLSPMSAVKQLVCDGRPDSTVT